MDDCLLNSARERYHIDLISSGVLGISEGVATNADKSGKASREIARAICEIIDVPPVKSKLDGQKAGRLFEEKTALFIQNTFPLLQHIRPGTWIIRRVGNQSHIKTYDFAQHEHLADLSELIKDNPTLAASIGNDYMVSPDIIVARKPCSDDEINSPVKIADQNVARLAPIRLLNNRKPILHASISAKWTMRSDRAQNSRTEALNLIRNRKRALPHIMAVTGEPLPSRLASLALGTGDIDCIYHFALYELIQAVDEHSRGNHEDSKEILDILVNGKRLKDISDLPLDLAL